MYEKRSQPPSALVITGTFLLTLFFFSFTAAILYLSLKFEFVWD